MPQGKIDDVGDDPSSLTRNVGDLLKGMWRWLAGGYRPERTYMRGTGGRKSGRRAQRTGRTNETT